MAGQQDIDFDASGGHTQAAWSGRRYRQHMSLPPPPASDWSSQSWPPEPGRGSDRAGHSSGHPQVPLGDPLVPADLRGWIERVIGVVQRSLVPLLTLQLWVAAISAVLSFTMTRLLSNGQSANDAVGLLAFLGLMATLAIGMLTQAAGVYVAIRDAAGRPTTAKQGLRFAIKLAPALVPAGLAAGTLTFVGFVLFVIPGLYLTIVFAATLTGVITVERLGVMRCFELVNRRLWPTARRIIVAVLAGGTYSVITSYMVSVLSTPQSFNEAALEALFAIPLGVVAVGITTVSYAELRFHERSCMLTEQLADQLDR